MRLGRAASISKDGIEEGMLPRLAESERQAQHVIHMPVSRCHVFAVKLSLVHLALITTRGTSEAPITSGPVSSPWHLT